jgi:4-hydroxy-tetrahydrodipicolinate reductase
MGSRVLALAIQSGRFRIAGACERKGHPAVGRDAGDWSGSGRLGLDIVDELPAALPNPSVCVDFTFPESTRQTLDWAEKAQCALVIGTTGLSSGDQLRLDRAARLLPVVYSPNMSIGVNMMFKLIREAASGLGRAYDMEIIEYHHNLKKDAPSGTALKMAEILSGELGKDLKDAAVYHRQGITGERKKETIGIQSVRAGDIVGEHTVLFAGPGERLEITHRAGSRDNFAAGALKAAEWVVGKSAGLYDMQAVLGI